MPELPEVETTVNQLNKKVLFRTFVSVQTYLEKLNLKNINSNIKKVENFINFNKNF